MRIHLLALPNCQTTRAYPLCGFAQATIRFATLLKQLGHHVTLYASEENDAPCDELVTVITKEEIAALLGMGPWEYQHARMEADSPLFQLGNARAATEIGKRKQLRDLICQIGGAAQAYVSEKHPDLMTVEYSIGYSGSFAPYRVFESIAWQHETYGRQSITDGRFFDAVIPCGFDPAEFPVVMRPEPYALYLGRLVHRKGVGIACDAAKAAGMPLKVIGHGDPTLVTYGEYLGTVPDLAERNQWLSQASVVLCPTLYLEPFCCVAVEAQLCGTPVVATDWGGFTETVSQGVSGFRCHTLGEFVEGLRRSLALDRAAIRARAVATYSLDVIAPQYQAYFDRLALLWGDGFNTTTVLTERSLA